MPYRRLLLLAATALCFAAVPSTGYADPVPPGGCQGFGTITNEGNHDLVNINAGGSAEVSGAFSSSAQTPSGLSFRLQAYGSPNGMAVTPAVSWRIDGGSWNRAALQAQQQPQGDPFWVSSSTPVSLSGPGHHRVDLSFSAPNDGTARTYSFNGYFDTAPPCTQLAGTIGITGVAVRGGSGAGNGGSPGGGSSGSGGSGRAGSSATATPSKHTSAPSAPTTEPSAAGSSTAPPPSAAGVPVAVPAAVPPATLSATPTPSATPASAGTPLADRPVSAAQSSGGTAWLLAALATGAVLATGTAVLIRRRFRPTDPAGEEQP